MLKGERERDNVVRFIIVGGINTVVDIASFFVLFYAFGFDLVSANVIAFLIAVTNSYALNKSWSFSHLRSNKHTMLEYAQFVIVSIVAVGLSTAILVYGQAWLDIPYLKLAAAAITPAFNFLLYRFLVFTPRAGGRSASDR